MCELFLVVLIGVVIGLQSGVFSIQLLVDISVVVVDVVLVDIFLVVVVGNYVVSFGVYGSQVDVDVVIVYFRKLQFFGFSELVMINGCLVWCVCVGFYVDCV